MPCGVAQNEEAAKLSSAAMTDDELMAAKNAFFQTDKDGSGAIDREEIAVMMKSLGQAPTKKMIDDIINSADGNHKLDADSNGKIEPREFLQWFTPSSQWFTPPHPSQVPPLDRHALPRLAPARHRLLLQQPPVEQVVGGDRVSGESVSGERGGGGGGRHLVAGRRMALHE